MSNSYLHLARKTLEAEKRPLTPLEILSIAGERGWIPSHLHGSTMHKTLMARLAEHIREEGSRAEFFRTAPGTFFLHTLAQLPDTPEEFKNVYKGFLRSKSIRKEDVLVAPKDKLEESIFGEFVPFNEDNFQSFFNSYCEFVDRAAAEENHALKQFVTFALVFSGEKLLTYRRGTFTTTSEKLKGQLTVGFGGHVNDTDFNLFHHGGEAFKANAARELREELFLDEIYADFDETMKRTKILGYVNVDGDFDAEHHIAILVAFNHASDDLPKKGELAITQLSWVDLEENIDDFEEYDYWSQIILRNLSTGRVKIPRWGFGKN